MQAKKRLKKLRPFGVGLSQAVGDGEAEWSEERLEDKRNRIYQWFGLKEWWGKGLRRQRGEWGGKIMLFRDSQAISKGLVRVWEGTGEGREFRHGKLKTFCEKMEMLRGQLEIIPTWCSQNMWTWETTNPTGGFQPSLPTRPFRLTA